MKMMKQLTVLAALCGAALGVGGCGGESPFAATSVNGSSIVLRGTVLNMVPPAAAGVSASSAGTKGTASAASAEEGTITVTVVEDPNITTTVAPDGSFVLRGLPAGSFTLLFKDAAGKELGTLPFGAVRPNQELTVSVKIVDGRVVLVEERRNGIGHADVEIQGSISQITLLDPAGDSLFVIAGYDVVARPGATAIRRDNVALSVGELAVGDQVHVKGAWLPLESGMDAADQQVLAHEIKLQDEDGDSDGEKITICHKKKQTLSISVSAWPAHMAHGDTRGACR